MATPQRKSGFGRCKVLMSKQLHGDTITDLAEYFELPPSETDGVTPLTSLRFLQILHKRREITPDRINELLVALHEINCLQEKEAVSKIFAEYIQSKERFVTQDEEMLTSDAEICTEDGDGGKLQEEEMSNSTSEDDVEDDTDESKDSNVLKNMEGSFAENKGTDIPIYTEWCKVKVIRMHDGRGNRDLNVGEDVLARCTAVCVILEISEMTNCIGHPVGLYLYEHKYNFEQDKFYRLQQFHMIKREDRLEILVSRNSRIYALSQKMVKNKKQYKVANISALTFPPKIRLSTSVTVKEACEIRQRRNILSIRGIVFEINKKAAITTFQLSDDGQTTVTVVVPHGKYPFEAGITEKDMVELRFLTAYTEGTKMKYLLFDDKTEVTHLRESDPKLASLLNCDLVNRASRLEGTVVECGEPEYYPACKKCFQTKLGQLRNGMYKCFKCGETYKPKKVSDCFTVSLQIQGPSEEDVWQGITFTNVVNEILKSGYPNEPDEQSVDALSSLLVDRKVQFTRRKCNPPLRDVFLKFILL